MDERGEVALGLLGGFVERNGLDQQRRESPRFSQGLADVGVRAVEMLVFELDQLAVVFAGLGEELVVLLAEGLAHGEHAQVLEQAAEERLLLLDEAHLLGEGLGGGGGVQAPLPEREVVEALAAGFLEVPDEGEAQGEGLDGVEAEDDQRVADGRDRVRLAVEGAVNGLKDLAGEGGVVLDGAGDLLDVDIALLHEVDDLESDRGEAGQPRRRQHTVEHLLIHAWRP